MTSLTSAYLRGTISNTSPAPPSPWTTGPVGPGPAMSAAGVRLVMLIATARAASGLAATWMGAAPVMVRVSILPFWAKFSDWINPCLPTGNTRLGARLALAKAKTVVMPSLLTTENCASCWLNDSTRRDSDGDGSAGVTATIWIGPVDGGDSPWAPAGDRCQARV